MSESIERMNAWMRGRLATASAEPTEGIAPEGPGQGAVDLGAGRSEPLRNPGSYGREAVEAILRGRIAPRRGGTYADELIRRSAIEDLIDKHIR